jgi:hypothetical protein
MGDLDGDGTVETVISGKVKLDGNTTGSAVMVFQPNGVRRTGWTIAVLAGLPVYSGFFPSQAPALGDLDGNGKLEIVVPLPDGTIRAYRENGSQLWSYNYAQGRKLFASEAAIGDVTGDGSLDVIFGTYSPDGSANSYVSVIGLSATGSLLPNFPLTLTHEGSASIKGVRAGITLADLDQDCDVEILAGSAGGTLYVWDLPAAYREERMPWPTSRHDNRRSAFMSGPIGVLAASTPGAASNAIYLPVVMKNACLE